MKGVSRGRVGSSGAAGLAAGMLLFAAGAVLLGGCRDKAKPGAAGVPRPLVAGVSVVTVSAAPEEAFEEAVGTVRARTIAAVAPQVMGRVTSFPVSEGSAVRKGALLATIDAAAVRAEAAAAEGMVAEAAAAQEEAARAVDQARASRALAEKTYARFRTLHEERVVTQQEFEEVEAKRTLADKDYERAVMRRAQSAARVEQAKGRADAAAAMLSYTRVTAPFSGVVTGKNADAGSMAVPGTPLLTLEDTSRYRFEAAVPEEHLHRLSVGSKVQVVLDAASGRAIPAVLSEIVPAVDPMTRTFLVKADVTGAFLRTGMFGRLRFPAGKRKVLAVPREAVLREGGVDGVFVVTPDNVARLVVVRTGRAMGDRIELLSGVDPGVRVAVSPLDRLTDGAPVEVRR